MNIFYPVSTNISEKITNEFEKAIRNEKDPLKSFEMFESSQFIKSMLDDDEDKKEYFFKNKKILYSEYGKLVKKL